MTNPKLQVSNKAISMDQLTTGSDTSVVILAPHPDDFDAIGVSLKRLQDNGCKLKLLVATAGINGVESGFENARTPGDKKGLRQQEQLDSCLFFGLDPELIEFLDLANNGDGSLAIDEANTRIIRKGLSGANADIVCLPHFNDSNMTHQRVYALYNRARRDWEKPHFALLNCDVKTRGMPCDVYTPFDDQTADWKRQLLRHHTSQQQRNLNSRSKGFDERVLDFNKTLAEQLPTDTPYAEAFAIEHHETGSE